MPTPIPVSVYTPCALRPVTGSVPVATPTVAVGYKVTSLRRLGGGDALRWFHAAIALGFAARTMSPWDPIRTAKSAVDRSTLRPAAGNPPPSSTRYWERSVANAPF